MRLIAIMPCRNSDWILGLTARAALMWCDQVILLNHASTDRTRKICEELVRENPLRVAFHGTQDSTWREMAHRQLLLDAARARGASHIALVDDDEILSGNLLPTIRGHIEHTPGRMMFTVPWIWLRGSIHKYHLRGPWAMSDVSTAFKDAPEWSWSAAAQGGYDHHHRHPFGHPWVPFRPLGRRDGGLMHLQAVSDRRVRAKALLYCLTERLRWPDRKTPAELNKQYGLAVYDESPASLASLGDVPVEWWAPYAGLMQHLHPEAEPWQLAAARAMIREHPGIENGLDTFGVL